MIHREFHHPVMRWSIYTREADLTGLEELCRQEGRQPSLEEVLKALGSQELDLEAPGCLRDGLYDFIILEQPPDPTRHRGVAVQAGRFMPHTTASAIWLAQVRRTGSGRPGHVYIEELEWKGDHFQVFLGS